MHWILDSDDTPLDDVRERLQFAVQVQDADGLQLPSPIRGQVQIRPDRPPVGAAGILHRLVLPNAVPRIKIRVNDDFGIRRLRLRLLVERRQERAMVVAPGVTLDPQTPANNEGSSPQEISASIATYAPGSSPPLPLDLTHPLQLSALQLVKGDRVKITLEVVDDRGENPGVVFLADPLVVEVGDEPDVLAAVSELDEQSERKLDELIRQQVEIGESP